MENIKVIFLDVDGTLTDGKIYYNNLGEEFKAFNVKDGMAISSLIDLGIEIIILTGRKSKIVEVRAKELGIKKLYQGIKNKKRIIEEVKSKMKIGFEEMMYIGDDTNDLECMEKVGISACPKDAASEVLNVSSYISKYKGGEGAVRDIIDKFFIKSMYDVKIISKNAVQ